MAKPLYLTGALRRGWRGDTANSGRRIGKLVLEEQIPYAFAFDIDTEEIVAWRR